MGMTMNESRNGGGSVRTVPDPQVPDKPQRRRYTAQYKLGVLEEVDRCSEPGQIGAVLRREGLYWSALQRWRRLRGRGILGALGSKKRGPKAQPQRQLLQRLAELERNNERLQRQLERAEKIIDVQKKVSELLGLEPPREPNGGQS